MLLGQNVNSYGKNLEEPMSFAQLLQEIEKIEGLERIRFMTSHPKDLSDELIEVMKNSKKICKHLHLPVQSGSTEILKKMNRHYTREYYMELVNKIKNEIPGVSLTTDIIVGFPGETEEDFQDTLDIVNECKYDSAFTFIFSPRIGTPAAKMEDNTPLSEKEERLQRLNKVINNYSLEANKQYLNKDVNVLIEGISEKDPNKVFGYTETMKLVNVENASDKVGQIISVKITDAKSFSLDGIAN
jgi:tRNA-2-methylthio-N6-dimethylallyladenosine synthase